MTLLNIFWIAQEGQLRKHIIATITSRFASSLLRHRWDYIFVTSQTSTYFMFSFHQSFTDESDAFSSKIASHQLQLFDLMQTFD